MTNGVLTKNIQRYEMRLKNIINKYVQRDDVDD